MRVAICSFVRGSSPILAVEYARRSIPVESRPSFLDLETTIRRDARIPAVPKPEDPAQPKGVENEQSVEPAPVSEPT
jgi:chemotaxis protein MotA